MTCLTLTTTQRDEAWHRARLGRLTGSRVADAFATIKSKGEAAGRRNLRVQLVLERITGQSQENSFVSPEMQRGADLEAEALAQYEEQTGAFISPTGLLAHPALMAGCSPDGLIGDDGLIEVKAPIAATHLHYLRGGIPDGYLLQMQHALWITGRAWCDFVSYHPSFPPSLRLKIARVTMTEAGLEAHEAAVRAFLAEVDQEEAALRAMAAPATAVPA